jgi:hypothetical protein
MSRPVTLFYKGYSIEYHVNRDGRWQAVVPETIGTENIIILAATNVAILLQRIQEAIDVQLDSGKLPDIEVFCVVPAINKWLT